MLKAYIVTKYASFNNLVKIEERTILCLDNSLERILTIGRTPNILVSAKAQEISNTLLVPCQEEENDFAKIDLGIQALNKKGFQEIDVLLEECTDFEYVFSLLTIFKHFPTIRLFAKMKTAVITIYEKGSYLLNRNDTPYIRLYPLAETLKFSLEHTQTKIAHQIISSQTGSLCHRNYLAGRVAVLHIEKGTAMCVQAKEEEICHE